MNDVPLTPFISPYAIDYPFDWKKQFKTRSLDIEIGCGNGETIIRMAGQFPEKNFVGIDHDWTCVYKTLRAYKKNQESAEKLDGLAEHYSGLKNIKILPMDARTALKRLFIPNSIDHITSIFPCPWPKKSHTKNRLFSKDFLKLLNNRLKAEGSLTITTDYYPYKEWILEQSRHTGFSVKTQTIRPRYNTKFERKWRQEGQDKFYELRMIKKNSIPIKVEEDIALESYKINHFNPRNFKFNEHSGSASAKLKGDSRGGSDNIAVVFKEMFFDPQRQTAMVQVLVSEQELTQYVWFSFKKKSDSWRIFKTHGQQIYPTPGIALALKLVYEAAGGDK